MGTDRRHRFARGVITVVVLASCLQVAAASVAPATGAGDPSVVGSWTEPFDLPVKVVHGILLPNAKVLLFSYPVHDVGSDAWLWDPATGDTTDVSLTWPRDIFCAGHTVLPDGTVFITGGHVHGVRWGRGVVNTDLFDPGKNLWTTGPLLSVARWYPTNVELGDGRVLVFGGQIDNGQPSVSVDVYSPASNTITPLPSSVDRVLGGYPRLHLLPNGKLFLADVRHGSSAAVLPQTQIFDPTTDVWTPLGTPLFGARGASVTSVLLPGLHQVLDAGGSDETGKVTASAEIIDLAAPTPNWRSTAPMNVARHWANGVLLPDGTVLVVGGSKHGGYGGPVREAESFDPVTETWTAMASQAAPRAYHSIALLLPDGRVLSAGGDKGKYRFTGEVFSPPYLFKGPRPTITEAPAVVTYGQGFQVRTPDADSIARVALVRPGSVTHSIDMDQRYVDLTFGSADGGTALDVVAPVDGNTAPPGWYMLFVVSADGVPSVASWVHIG